MKSVIVTGGCGYIGSHIARAFKKNGDKVFIIDRTQRDHTLKDVDGYFIGDYAADDTLSAIMAMTPDVVVHCAGTSLVGPSRRDPAMYYENNVAKSIRFLKFLANLDKKPLVMFSSSASVYGQPGGDMFPLKETCPLNPISPYGKTKYMIEEILVDFYVAYNLNSIIFRYFNAAGAEPFNFDLGQEPGASHLVAKLLEANISGEPFFLNGDNFDTIDGTCIRDYVHVWDIATAHIHAVAYVNAHDPETNTFNMTFNLGTNMGISNKQMISYVNEHIGPTKIILNNRRLGDPKELVADSIRAQQILGWQPKYSSIETIVDSAYKWYTRT